MSNQEADDCAALVVEIFGMLPRTPDTGGTSRQSAAVVQLRSVDCATPEFDVGSLIATN
jgi:hypothetical protein